MVRERQLQPSFEALENLVRRAVGHPESVGGLAETAESGDGKELGQTDEYIVARHGWIRGRVARIEFD